MKKYLLLMLTILMGAMWSSVDAKWIIGERKSASQLHPGDTIVLEQSSRDKYLGYYLQAVDTENGVECLEGIGAGSASILVLEEGPEDIRTGAPTVYIKLLENGKYIGKNDKGEVVGVDNAKRLLEDIPNKVSNTLGLVLGICLPRRSGKAIHCNQCAVKPDPYFIQRGLLSPFWRNCPRVERHCSAGIFYGQGRDGMG